MTGSVDSRQNWIGYRVASWRRVQDMSQQGLADTMGVSREYISMIENGRRAVTRRATVDALADALGIGPEDLTGQPVRPLTRAEHAVYTMASDIRRALDEPDTTRDIRPIEELAADADRMLSLRMEGDWEEVPRVLPGLLTETTVAAENGERGLAAHVKTLLSCSANVRFIGFIDLGRLFAERAMDAARRLGDPEHLGAATFFLAQSVMQCGGRARSEAMAVQMADSLPDDTPGCREWIVMLNLQAGFSAAMLGKVDEEQARFEEAATQARRTFTDAWFMEPKIANVDNWRIAGALEDGNAEQAPDLARRVDLTQLKTVDRRSRWWFDTGRGWFARGDHDQCIRAFLKADEMYPLSLWTKPQALEITGAMVRDAKTGRGSTELRALCAAVGLDPSAPDVPGTV